jgi:hypothetical protein
MESSKLIYKEKDGVNRVFLETKILVYDTQGMTLDEFKKTGLPVKYSYTNMSVALEDIKFMFETKDYQGHTEIGCNGRTFIIPIEYSRMKEMFSPFISYLKLNVRQK